MTRFREFRVGDEFQSTCSISEGELESYLGFARIRNALLDGKAVGGKDSARMYEVTSPA